MKPRYFLISLFVLTSSVAFAQIPTTVTSINDPGTLLSWINDAQRYATTIENAIQQLQLADQTLEYQISAAKQLESGSWQGFVNAWNDESVSVNNFAALMANMPSLSQIQAIQELVDTQGYQAASANMKVFQTNWNNATNIVHTTDTLVKNTQSRERLGAKPRQFPNENGDVRQLQVLNQQLGLLYGETADVNMNLSAWKQYTVARIEQDKLTARNHRPTAASCRNLILFRPTCRHGPTRRSNGPRPR